MTNASQAEVLLEIPKPEPIIQPRDSSLAIVSMITGIACWFIIPLVGALVSVITGHLAFKEIHSGRGIITGKGKATTGLILGYLQLGIFLQAFSVVIFLVLSGLPISEIFKSVIGIF